jgi:hypothetical protein
MADARREHLAGAFRQIDRRVDRLAIFAYFELEGATAVGVGAHLGDALSLCDDSAFLDQQFADVAVSRHEMAVMLDDNQSAIRLDACSCVDHPTAFGSLDLFAHAAAQFSTPLERPVKNFAVMGPGTGHLKRLASA